MMKRGRRIPRRREISLEGNCIYEWIALHSREGVPGPVGISAQARGEIPAAQVEKTPAPLFRDRRDHQVKLSLMGNGVGDTWSDSPMALGSNGCQPLPARGSELKAVRA